MGPMHRVVLFLMLIAISHTGSGLNASVGLNDTSTFVLVREADGIRLYERWYPVTPGLLSREVKATFRMRATPDDAVALIKDASKGQRWNKNSCRYEVVDLLQDSWTSYIQYDLPWPVSNQDCVLKYEQVNESDTISIFFEGISHPSFPEKKRIQRIRELRGKWVFVKSEDEYHVEYFISSTSSKTLPEWVTDPIIRKNLVHTLASFRALVEGQK